MRRRSVHDERKGWTVKRYINSDSVALHAPLNLHKFVSTRSNSVRFVLANYIKSEGHGAWQAFKRLRTYAKLYGCWPDPKKDKS